MMRDGELIKNYTKQLTLQISTLHGNLSALTEENFKLKLSNEQFMREFDDLKISFKNDDSLTGVLILKKTKSGMRFEQNANFRAGMDDEGFYTIDN